MSSIKNKLQTKITHLTYAWKNKWAKEQEEQKRISLLRYWTIRYLVTLVIGLAVIGFVTGIIIRQSTLNKNLEIDQYLAEEVAARMLDQIVGTDIPTDGNDELFYNRKKLLETSGSPSIYIVDPSGTILMENRSENHLRISSFSEKLISSEDEVRKLNNIGGRDYYLIKRPITLNNSVLGWVVVIQSEAELTAVDQEYKLLFLMILSAAMLGWAAIYFLSKRLLKPIENVAKAAKEVEAGNYDVELNERVREQEVYDLVHSFKEMALKLEQLESIRAELLAGVTHELKTPVTSISGLLQAVNDKVVTGEEAKEFLAISLQETNRLQKMVGDLLDFNSFAANAIPVNKKPCFIGESVKEMVYQWSIIQDNSDIEVAIDKPEEDFEVYTDTLRLQQILINLLNNAKQAIQGDGKITITIHPTDGEWLAIDVQDNGTGIPDAEQDLIFERFYRGEEKKYKVRGLGLGLPFSKMLARAMGGDLKLLKSNGEGTTFTINLPYRDE
ncbi:ATP-binding protein [Pradoshia sp.]|uniref:HAMP domain-containing sensor histidine kinase n=1 Tax=Pradoshia sp. TaxID=2651281 RepID=UPI003F122A2C